MPYIKRYYTPNKRRGRYKKSTYKKRSYRYSKYAPRRKYYRKRGFSQIQNIGVKGATTFPQKANTKLIYNDTDFTLSTTIGNGYNTSHVFRGNDIYDPDFSGVGIQPYYFDTFATLYNRYQVYASKITVYMTSDSSADISKLIQTSLLPYQLNSLSYVEPNDLRNVDKCKQISWNQDRNDNKRCKISNYCKTKWIFNNNDQSLTGAVTGNPDLKWYWHLFMDTSTTGVETDIQFDVKIKYYVRFYKRAEMNES